MQIPQQCFVDDFDKRIRFRETMTYFINVNQNILYNICFDDECTIFHNGHVGKQKCLY